MKHLLLSLVVVAVVACTLAFSRKSTGDAAPNPASPFRVVSEEKNPWTHLKPSGDPDQFQFAIVSDRTGGHRANTFARAVHQLNLLQPEFVMSVGDLIEGYTAKPEVMAKEWDEFDSYVKKLDMPFFYVPGNHDLSNAKMVEYWGGRYGRSYYHFVYKNVLFLNISSDDGKSATVSPKQIESIQKVLDDNKTVRWTLAFVHYPLWIEKGPEKAGWLEVEKALAGRKYTVFCGHMHQYQKYIRNGMNYYQLATTGGGSKLRGVEYGEFDHLTWITMRNDGPLLANILMDGILPENLQLPETSEPGVVTKKQPLFTVKGRVLVDGKPMAGVMLSFEQTDTPRGFGKAYPDGVTDAEGYFTLSTYSKYDGAPAGKYRVALWKTDRRPGFDNGERDDKSHLPAQYQKISTSPLVLEIKAGGLNEPVIAITTK